MTQKQLMAELFDLVRTSQRDQREMMGQMLEAQKAQSEVLSQWLSMFKPPSTSIKSTTFDEREEIKKVENIEEWEPLDMAEVAALMSTAVSE